MNAQMLQGADAAHMARMQKKLALDNRVKTGLGWFYWIAGLSLVNTAAYLFGTSWGFVAGLGITQVVDAIMNLIAKDLGESGIYLRAAGVIIDLVIAAAFVLFGYFGRKGVQWPVIVGMVLYLLDTILLLLLQSWLAAAFHGWALYGIWTGLKALRESQALAKTTVFGVPVTPVHS
jgi:hypothetical protein